MSGSCARRLGAARDVPTGWIAELPDSVSFEQAATLPVAGITALETLDIGGNPLGRRVLVTGASGGVGTFAIQLAKQAGAHVTALARRQEGAARARRGRRSSTRSRTAPSTTRPRRRRRRPSWARRSARSRQAAPSSRSHRPSPSPSSYPTRALFGRAPGAKLVGFLVFRSVRDGAGTLARLGDLVADGRLDPQIDRVGVVARSAGPIQDLLDGRVAGKAVLTID